MDLATVIEAAAAASASALAMRGAGKVVENESVVLWDRFKATVVQRLGPNNKLSAGIEAIEQDPQALDGVPQLQDAIRETNADQDAEIVAAAQHLAERFPQFLNSVQQNNFSGGMGTIHGHIINYNGLDPKSQLRE